MADRTLAELGRLIQQTREARGLTQDALASTANTSRTTVALLEQGRRLCDGEVLNAICRHVGLVENFWLHASVRKLAPGQQCSVRCHCLTYYTSKGRITSDDEQRRYDFALAVKNGKRVTVRGNSQTAAAYAAEMLRAEHSHLFVRRTLVPVPTSVASVAVQDNAWPALRVAHEITALSTGSEVRRLIERHTTIRKSSIPGQSRPNVAEHIATFRVTNDNGDPLPLGIVLVDDVVTRGTQMAACAKLLRDAGWPGEIDGLAIAFTRGREDTSPTEGSVFTYSWNGRSPYPDRATVPR